MDFIPTKKEEKQMKELVSKILKKIKVKDARPSLGGSGAKGTWLSNVHDIDIYVKFNYRKHVNKDISTILGRSLKKSFSKVTKLHGSRDYFQIKSGKTTIEIVPILDIKKASEAKNITDVSQLHVNYVNRYPKLKNDIRKAKMFCKAAFVYGAESYIQGFSGYLIELLVIKYNGFNKFTRNVSKWKSKVEIGNKGHIKNLNKSKKVSPLIFIDPVDSTRNAAAALNNEMNQKLIKACKAYSKKPSDKFFKIKEFNLKETKKKYNLIFEVKDIRKGKRDVVGASIRKRFERTIRELEHNNFRISNKGWNWDKNTYFYFKLKELKLPTIKEVIGPPLKIKDGCKNFKRKYKKTYARKGRLCTKIKRKVIDARKIKPLDVSLKAV